MLNRINRCLGVGLAGACLGSLAVAPMSGCESSNLGGLLGSPAAMELLSPLVKQAANTYLNDLALLTESLGELTSLSGVLAFVEKIEPTVRQLSSAYQTLAGTTGDERANLLKAFGPKFESANASFLQASTEATGDGMWNRALSPVLEQVNMFE